MRLSHEGTDKTWQQRRFLAMQGRASRAWEDVSESELRKGDVENRFNRYTKKRNEMIESGRESGRQLRNISA